MWELLIAGGVLAYLAAMLWLPSASIDHKLVLVHIGAVAERSGVSEGTLERARLVFGLFLRRWVLGRLVF